MFEQIATAAGLLLTTGFSGGVALGVRRLLQGQDTMAKIQQQHGEKIAAMEVKLPNGEWRELKDGVAELHGGVRKVSASLETLTLEFRDHAATEKGRMCEAIEETFPRLRPEKLVVTRRRRK